MDNQKLHAIRHSLAHIMASAIKKLWPSTKFGIGPVIDKGFYYDVDIPGHVIKEDDLTVIEKEMNAIIKQDLPFRQTDKSIAEAINDEQQAQQTYKVELLNDLKKYGTTNLREIESIPVSDNQTSKKNTTVSYYTHGDFTDLCQGPHIESTGKVGVFKLTHLAGAYWRGDENKPQMQRVYGLGFANQADLDSYLEMLEAAKERDHRKLGKEMDLFTFSDLVGAGLPLYTVNGTLVRDKLIAFSEKLRSKTGFQKVWSPHMTKTELYEISGHWAKFGSELFLVTSQETSDKLVLKPMNCPHHSQIYQSRQRSYKDLPVKLMETTTNYRDEKTGELHGLSRVRSLTQDDSHAYCTEEQAEDVIVSLVEAVQQFYDGIGFNQLRIRLSLRDESDAYLGTKEQWQFGQDKIEEIVKKHQLDYFKEEGEAAFYGPKIDYMAKDSIGREWQVATIQFDFVQPTRFKLEYVDSNGGIQQPYMIHCAIMGSFDRFFSVYIEHTNGHFPFWLAPEQVRILTINDESIAYAQQIKDKLENVVLMEPLKYNEIKVTIDERNESLGKKIREGELAKVPLLAVVGPKDQKEQTISFRINNKNHTVKLVEINEFITTM